MTDLILRTLDGGDRRFDTDAMAGLAGELRGHLVTPASPGYDQMRRIWNAMIDCHPGVIVRCAGAADVMRAVDFARAHGLVTAVRGGGHGIAGHAVCDGGVLIDLAPMKSVRVEPSERVAWVEPGATLGDFDNEAQAFGLATPLGINSTTGVAGLTLGGGFGWLSRKHGMTIDNLLGADVVTADGRLVRASDDENPDLFWALRGGSGNFGIVTNFRFRLHPVGPQVLAGLVVHRLEDAGPLLRRYRDLAKAMPDDFTCWAVLRKAPPLPFLPAEVHGTEILAFALCHAGDPASGQEQATSILAMGDPVGTQVGPVPFTAWQQAFDPLLTPGARNYWKSHNFAALSDGLLDLVVDYAGKLPTAQCEIFIGQVGGATMRPPVEAMAYPHRDAAFVMNVHTRWEEPRDDEMCIRWARAFSDAAATHSTGGVYVNFVGHDEQRTAAAYGSNFARLQEIKRKYDPDNFFRLNQNIRLGAAA